MTQSPVIHSLVAILKNTPVTEACTQSSDTNGYSLQRSLANKEYLVASLRAYYPVRMRKGVK